MQIIIATRSRYPNGPTPQRMDLFRRVTVPSLLGQTDRDFIWQIDVSDREHSNWIASVAGKLNIRLRTSALCAQHDSAHSEVRMVRMDDDDALTIDFIARLRKAGPHSPGTWYVFPNGYRVHNGRFAPYHNPTNQFIALDIPNGSRESVYKINHSRVCDERDVVELDAKPAWLFVRHSETKSPGGRQPTKHPLHRLAGFAVDRDFLSEVT